MGDKRINYNDYRTSVIMMKDKEHLTEKGREYIKNLKSGMNTKRTYLNWDHLKDFYSK